MAHNYFGETDVANIQNDLIASVVQTQLKESVRLLPTILDLSAMAVPGLQSVSVPRGSALTASDKAEDTALNFSHFTYAADQLSLAQYYVGVDVDDIARVQSSIPLMQDLMSRMGVALADKIDTLIYDQIKLGSASAPDHLIDYTDGTNNDIEIADIVEANKLLNIQKVPRADRFMLISPTQESNMLKIDSFVEADKYGARDSILNGEIGRVYGFKVIVSNVAESDNYSIFYHKSAAAFAMQENIKFEQGRYLKTLSNEMVASFIGGCKLMDAGVRNVRIYEAA